MNKLALTVVIIMAVLLIVLSVGIGDFWFTVNGISMEFDSFAEFFFVNLSIGFMWISFLIGIVSVIPLLFKIYSIIKKYDENGDEWL